MYCRKREDSRSHINRPRRMFARYVKYACVSTPVTRLCITHDDQFLVAADEASCLFVFDVRDRQDRGQAGSKLGGGELQPLAASEVLVVAFKPALRW